jgi:eukaryotic-like serine/threonine-protein kinase
MSAVLSRDPDWEALPSAVPPSARALLRRCLQKEPQKRLRDIGDARIELEETLADPSRCDVKASPHTRRTLRMWLMGGACLIIGALAAGITAWSFRPKDLPATVARFTVNLPPNEIISPPSPSRRHLTRRNPCGLHRESRWPDSDLSPRHR